MAKNLNSLQMTVPAEALSETAEINREETAGTADSVSLEGQRSITENPELDGATREIVALTALLREYDSALSAHVKRERLARQLLAALYSQPTWFSLLPKVVRREYESRRLRRLNVFDATSYLATYPDVRAAGINPLLHYLLHGLWEDRENGIDPNASA